LTVVSYNGPDGQFPDLSRKVAAAMMLFDPVYFLFVAPAMLLAFWAQMKVHSTYQRAMQEPAPLSGAAAARLILDQGGLHDIPIEEVPGELSDHYDPRTRVVRLSSAVYHTPSLGAVGIAAHEVGHALQHAHNYAPLALRSVAVPAAIIGPNVAIVLVILGAVIASSALVLGKAVLLIGLVLFCAIVAFQLINLPVEFDASARAKRELAALQIVDNQGAAVVRDVLNAAALTYVAATLQAILTLLYLVFRYGGILGRSSRD
jgi:Zn-dependent membrane protease YugP